MGTFAGLLAVLFGAGCKLYSDALWARILLGEDGIAMLTDRFTPLQIRQYYWAIIDKGHRYFHQVVAPDDFDSGSNIQWPTLGLKDVIWKIRNVTEVLRPTFPEEWRQRETSRFPPPPDSVGRHRKHIRRQDIKGNYPGA